MSRTCWPLLCLFALSLLGCGGESSAASEDIADVSVSDGVTDGTTDTTPAGTKVGPGGGTVKFDGGSLVIPAGALSDEVTISITPVPMPATGEFKPRGQFYTFEPSGLLFNKHATLALPVDSGKTEGLLGVAWTEDGVTWRSLPGAEVVGAEVTVLILGFSTGGAAEFGGNVCCRLSTLQGTQVKILGSAECQKWADETPDAEVELDPTLGDCKVCCQDPVGLSNALTCPAASLYLEDCAPVCCFTGEIAEVVPGVLCAGEVKGDASSCDSVCCNKSGFLLQMSAWQCAQDLGNVVAAEQCDEACCLWGANATVKPAGECLGDVQPVGSCDPVCCYMNGEDGVVTARGFCTNPEALYEDPAQCDTICCQLDATHHLSATRAYCEESLGVGVADASQCERICCYVDGEDGIPEEKADCANAQLVLPIEKCEQTCCYGQGYGHFIASIGLCGELGGVAGYGEDMCEKICCYTKELGSVVDERGDCEISALEVGPESSCSDVCCVTNEVEFAVLSGLECELRWGTPDSDLAQCDTVCCLSSQEALVRPRGLCEPPAEALLDLNQCDRVCCDLAGVDFLSLTDDECLQLSGSEVDPILCKEMCCELNGEVSVQTVGICQAQGGTPDPELLTCGGACCERPANACLKPVCVNGSTCEEDYIDGADCAVHDECPSGQGCALWCTCTHLLGPGVSPGQESVNPLDGAPVVWVPAGPYLAGTTDAQGQALWGAYWLPGMYGPQVEITLTKGFWMYKYEVTVLMFQEFVDTVGAWMPPEPEWGWQDEAPIHNGVNWYWADQYAQRVGASLPTNAQWEKAAKGTDGRVFPWGDTYTAGVTADWSNRMVGVPDGPVTQNLGPAVVGSYPQDTSPYGMMDAAGNVMEWMADAWPAPGATYSDGESVDPVGSGSSSLYGRGGDWMTYSPKGGSKAAGYYATGMWSSGATNVGFRCVIVPEGQ